MRTVYTPEHINPDKDVSLQPPDFLYYPEEPEPCFHKREPLKIPEDIE